MELSLGCSLPATNQEVWASLGEGTYEADAILWGPSSGVAPTFGVATSQRSGIMAYLAGVCALCCVPGFGPKLVRSI